MSFFDFTADYKSSPSLPKQEPDPFANYVEPAGDLTTQNFAAWDTPAPANTPAPAATYTPVAQNKWNEQYQAWEDQSGNLWDSTSGLWYSITDPSNPLIYRPEVGWQNVTQYNDYNNELNALGAYSANPIESTPSWFTPQPLGKQISSGDWQNIQSYMDRPEPSPRADFINYDLATSKNVPFPEDVRYSLENADLPYEIRNGAKWYGAPVEGGGLTAPWDKYAEPAAAKLGDAYNWYTKNIQTPISETLSQVTPPHSLSPRIRFPVCNSRSPPATSRRATTPTNASSREPRNSAAQLENPVATP
ncbi:MAG: hypothetical protein IPI85_16825 [Dehalococcoidia bacterium]|nr:hypothetical protein [Dehalococcoidia bacterium]